MKVVLVLTGIIGVVLLYTHCSEPEVNNKKDLDENMLDMRVYHDNLGQYLRRGDADYASWLLEGLDSSLKVIADKFDEHRKLDAPFEKHYQKLLAPPIKDIRSALRQNNIPVAISAYRILTKNCNRCHINLDVDKEVIDWSNAAFH